MSDPLTQSDWTEDEEFTLFDWRLEVASHSTRLGYREWVEHQEEQQQHEDGYNRD